MKWLLIFFSLGAFAEPMHPYFYEGHMGGQVSWLVGTTPSGDVSLSDFDPLLRKTFPLVKHALIEAIIPWEEEVVALTGQMVELPLAETLDAEAWGRYRKMIERRVEDRRFREMFYHQTPGAAALIAWRAAWEDSGLQYWLPGPHEPFPVQIVRALGAAGVQREMIETAGELSDRLGGLETKLANQALRETLDENGAAVLKSRTDFTLASANDIARYKEGTLIGQQAGEEVGYGPVMKNLINHRHAMWLSKILTQLNRAPTMVVVDARHVVGPNGLIVGLKQRGATIINMSCISAIAGKLN